MALVPNGRMRTQQGQSLLRNGWFSFAQATPPIEQPQQKPSQQTAQPKPQLDPRLEIQQDEIGDNDPMGGDEDGQDTGPSSPPINSDVAQDRAQRDADQATSSGESPEKQPLGEKGLVQFAKEMAQQIMKVPFRKLQQFGGFVSFKSDSQHNDKVDLKFPNWYYGQGNGPMPGPATIGKIGPNGQEDVDPATQSGEVSKQDKMKIIQEAQKRFNLFYEGSTGDDDNLIMSFSTVNPQQGMQTAHDARLQRTYKQLADPKGGPGKQKAASTMGEMIKDRNNEMFETMRKIAQRNK